VTLSFAKHDKVQISKEAYLSSYLYEGKSISQKEIDKLLEITALSILLNYALSLISKRHYSEKKLVEKLKVKDNNKEAINGVISKLKENNLLDDRALMEDLIAWDDERGFGKNKTIKHLKDQGIPDKLIAKAHFPVSNELKKAKGLLPKLDKKYAKYAYESKKKHIFSALLSQGYEIDIAKQVVGLAKKDQPKKEKEKLTNDFLKIKRRYENKYEGYELKKRIYAALVNKGYKHSEIKAVLEDVDYENDF
jgi:regulatory protein